MSSIRDEEAPVHLDPPLLKASDLFEEGWEMHHDSVTNHADCLWVQDARGDEVQRVSVSRLVIDGVTSIGSTLTENVREELKRADSWHVEPGLAHSRRSPAL